MGSGMAVQKRYLVPKGGPVSARSLGRFKEHLDKRLDRLFELAIANQAMLRDILNDIDRMQTYIGYLNNSFIDYQIRIGLKANGDKIS